MKKLPRLTVPTLTLILFVAIIKLPQTIQAAIIRFDQFGKPSLIGSEGVVLGIIADKGRDDQGESSSGSSGSSSNSQSSSASNSNPTTQALEKIEVKSSEVEKAETKESKSETKIKKDGTKFKLETETSAGVFKLEIEDGKVKIKQKIKSKETNGVESESEASASAGLERVELEESINLKTVKISALAGQMKIENQGVAALTKLPISLDSSTNQLIVTTPNKKMVVTTLSAQAIANLISRGIIDSAENLLEVPSKNASDSAQTEIKAPKTELVERNGAVVYRVVGQKSRKFLNLFPATFTLQAEVNAETGALVNLQEPSILRFFGFLFGK